jgi:hypothetical protein
MGGQGQDQIVNHVSKGTVGVSSDLVQCEIAGRCSAIAFRFRSGGAWLWQTWAGMGSGTGLARWIGGDGLQR